MDLEGLLNYAPYHLLVFILIMSSLSLYLGGLVSLLMKFWGSK
jgi:hypothetical protein